mmetsp:Transcript_32100/g.83232  ORF Transcript_32100/g.83232 Transcript_32100/m.83232 type:complete len:206 (+) Transcript_32100:38-655(+)
MRRSRRDEPSQQCETIQWSPSADDVVDRVLTRDSGDIECNGEGCCEVLQPQDPAHVAEACLHIFCQPCAQRLFRGRHPECPVCRADGRLSDIVMGEATSLKGCAPDRIMEMLQIAVEFHTKQRAMQAAASRDVVAMQKDYIWQLHREHRREKVEFENQINTMRHERDAARAVRLQRRLPDSPLGHSPGLIEVLGSRLHSDRLGGF